jgi:ribosomal protein S18 acetylase RimI-like enzyme
MTPNAPVLRHAQPDDEPFLFQVYASTRLEQLAPLGWSLEQQHAFLTQQFTAQHRHYQANYASADFQLILVNGQPAGRLYVARWPDEIRLIDIALLPEYRNAGVGSRLLNELLAEAAQAAKPVRLHVETFNRALRLYQRLGFVTIAVRGAHWFMERLPEVEAGRLPATVSE